MLCSIFNISVSKRDAARSHTITYISTFAARTMTSLNWLCSQASEERSIMARAALSLSCIGRSHMMSKRKENVQIHHI